MNNFDFKNTTHVVFGKDQIKQLSELIAPSEKVLVLYGGGSIKKNGVYDQVKSALKSHKWDEFSGIETNPQFKTLMKAVEKIKTEKYTYLLAVATVSQNPPKIAEPHRSKVSISHPYRQD